MSKAKVGMWSVCAIMSYLLYMTINGCMIAAEARRLEPRDPDHIRVREFHYAKSGIWLRVQAASGITRVLHGTNNRVLWKAKYPEVPFYINPVSEREHDVYVPMQFKSKEEWELAIMSNDGYWVSLSPYFTAEPELSEDDWNRMLASAHRGDTLGK